MYRLNQDFLQLLTFTLIAAFIKEISPSQICGTVTTLEGNVLELKEDSILTEEEFSKIHQRKLSQAMFRPSENCKIQVCGFTSLARRYSDIYFGSASDIAKCHTFSSDSQAPLAIFNDLFNASSISCACQKNKDGCSFNCKEKRAHLNLTWEGNECAKLFEDDKCSDCYYESKMLKTTTAYSTTYSNHITSLLIRDNCVVSQYIPAFKSYWRTKDSRLTIDYTYQDDSKMDNRGVESAYDSHPESFTCRCGVMVTPLPSSTSKLVLEDQEALMSGTTIVIAVVSCTSLLSLGFFIGCRKWKKRQIIDPTTTTTASTACSGAVTLCGNTVPWNVGCTCGFMPQKSIDILENIGGGNYGEVFKVRRPMKIMVEMAMKIALERQDCHGALKQEIEILVRIGKHSNIVTLYDHFTHEGKLYMFVEFCENGSLLSYLEDKVQPHIDELLRVEASKLQTSSASSTRAYLQAKDLVIQKPKEYDLEELDPQLLIQMYYWAEQIANGMAYVSSKKVIHGDLDCRNILLNRKLEIKLADFGLAHKNYVKENDPPTVRPAEIPVRLLAPEVLNSKEGYLESQSDVWSYGITVWEIFTCGKRIPYEGIRNESVKDRVSIEKPGRITGGVTQKIFNKLLECWKIDPKSRPSFESLRDHFAQERKLVQIPESMDTSTLWEIGSLTE